MYNPDKTEFMGNDIKPYRETYPKKIMDRSIIKHIIGLNHTTCQSKLWSNMEFTTAKDHWVDPFYRTYNRGDNCTTAKNQVLQYPEEANFIIQLIQDISTGWLQDKRNSYF